MSSTQALPLSATPAAAGQGYNFALGYLRAFLVLLVVAHHSALAYLLIAPPAPASLLVQPPWWQAFPVVDAHKWPFSLLFVSFNDNFFMALMFLLSGLFVSSALARKGVSRFLGDRFLRLGAPFLVIAAIVAPLAYYPTYLKTLDPTGLTGYAHQWLALGRWPSGPAWFLWVLLAFDAIAAILFALAPKRCESAGRFLSPVLNQPITLFACLALLSAAAYVPMALIFHPLSWTTAGPFTFQTSRILHYFVYFLVGVVAGSRGIDNGILAPSSKLARCWPLWMLVALACFAAVSVLTVASQWSPAHPLLLQVAIDGSFALSCAAISFAFLALFLRFANIRSRVFSSLTVNSYGIYALHYAFVSWLGYALLPAAMPGSAKFAIATVSAVLLSWATSAALRCIPAIARIL